MRGTGKQGTDRQTKRQTGLKKHLEERRERISKNAENYQRTKKCEQ